MNNKMKEHLEALENVVETRRLENEKLKLIVDRMKKSESDLETMIWGQKYISICEGFQRFEPMSRAVEVMALNGILKEVKKES